MQIAFNLADELVSRLSPREDKLPQILESGLRELNGSSQKRFAGTAEVLEFLTTLPTPVTNSERTLLNTTHLL